MSITFKDYVTLVETDLDSASDDQINEIFGRFFGKSPAKPAQQTKPTIGTQQPGAQPPETDNDPSSKVDYSKLTPEQKRLLLQKQKEALKQKEKHQQGVAKVKAAKERKDAEEWLKQQTKGFDANYGYQQ